jgi:ubiquinone/menaquinone biosynthesis C-methylase UbiE
MMPNPSGKLPNPDTSNSNQHLHDFLRWVLKKITLPKAPLVLDFGCGTGDLTRLLADHLGTGAHILAIDPSSKSIRAARARTGRSRYPQIEFRTIQTGTFPFRDGDFDLAFCARALLEVEDPQRIIDELARVLKPNGQLLALEMDLGGYFVAEVRELDPQRLPRMNPYIARALPTLMAEAGLESSDLFPNFVVSREPLTRDALEQKGAGVKTLRPRLRHLERLEFSDYMHKLQHAVAAQTKGYYSTLLEVAVLARKPG